MALLLAVLAVVTLAKGGFYIGKHEGDTLHMLQIVMRMAGGQWPHLDFQTPIGVFAFAPVSGLVAAGMGVGHAFLWAQVLVAVAAAPAIYWVALSRFPGGWSYLFAGMVLVLITALVHGEADRAVSVSMHYNRWAWAFAFLAIAPAILPALRQGAVLDGLVIGLALAALAMTKMTYFVAFVIPVVVALIGRRAWRSLVVGLIAGLAVVAAVTLAAGTPLFWLAYARDLFTVMGSEVRPHPGLAFSGVVGAPAYLGGSLTLLVAVIFLRQAGLALEGLVLLLLVPGFFYVTYQNYGNDPQWLGLLALVMMALVPARDMRNGLGWNLQRGIWTAGLLSMAFAAPSYFNLGYSTFRHLATDTEDYVPLVPGSGVHEDIRVSDLRGLRVDAKVPMDREGGLFAAMSDPEFRPDKMDLYGEDLPDCSIELGLVNWFATLAGDLEDSGLVQGKTLFVADILASFWLFGGPDPLPGASPWYYGGLPGIENADYLLVPLCPLSIDVRGKVLTAIEEGEIELTEVRRTGSYILYGL